MWCLLRNEQVLKLILHSFAALVCPSELLEACDVKAILVGCGRDLWRMFWSSSRGSVRIAKLQSLSIARQTISSRWSTLLL